jgi:hypothetical protein
LKHRLFWIIILDARLGGRDEQLVKVLCAFVLEAVGHLLAHDAERTRWYCRQAFGADVLFAMQADTETALSDAAERCPDIAQEIRIAVQATDRQFTLSGALYLIESIGAFFDCDTVAISYHVDQLRLLGL